MRTPRRKRQPEPFDVAEFLRDSDEDLKSALNSLLHSPAIQSEQSEATPDINIRPGIKVDPGQDLPPDDGVADEPGMLIVISAPGLNIEPEPEIAPDSKLMLPVKSGPGITLESATEKEASSRPPDLGGGINAGPGVNLGPDIHIGSEPELIPDLKLVAPVKSGSGINVAPADENDAFSRPGPERGPDLNIEPGRNLAPRPRKFPIREMKYASDAHSRAEQQIYDCLWQNAGPLDDVSRAITIGFGALARMVRLSESNARINLRSLVAKLAVEEYGEYNCAQSVGRTYRVLGETEILKRRKSAGLGWYMRRTLAVVFVDPATGQPIDLGIQRPGPKSVPGPKLIPGPDLVLLNALRQYGPADRDEAVRLREAVRRISPEAADDEILHFIEVKGELLKSRPGLIANPLAYLLTSVPKCFSGPEFADFREKQAAQRIRQEAEVQSWRREQQAILDDPSASEEDKRWAHMIPYPQQGR